SLREARSLEKLGQLVQAAEAYVRTTRAELGENSPQAFKDAVEQAQAELAKLRPRIPQLKIVIRGTKPEDVKLTLDGQTVSTALIGISRPVNPGEHRLIASTASGTRDEGSITL